jgi:hypothetical protein
MDNMNMHRSKQRILVFQQNESGESKIEGIREYATDGIALDIFSIDTPLPEILDDTTDYLPDDIQADVVLDFLTHPDLSQDLALICREKHIPVVASGKKMRIEGMITPPT